MCVEINVKRMYYLFIIQSQKDLSFYVGSTSNLEDRVNRHNSGRSPFTKARMPWKLVYSETFSSESEAIRCELQIKKWKSRKLILELIGASSV